MMTDAEIIKAFEYCNSREYKCDICYFRLQGQCRLELEEAVLDLINRQKAENERVKELLKGWKKEAYKVADEKDELYNNAVERIKITKSEAVKEFAERLKAEIEKARRKYQKLCKEQGEKEDEVMNIHFSGIIKIVDNLLKEME